LRTASQGWQGAASGKKGERQLFAAVAGRQRQALEEARALIQALMGSRKRTTVQMAAHCYPMVALTVVRRGIN
jgi:hypothetical protein